MLSRAPVPSPVLARCSQVQLKGCGVLRNIALGDDTCKQAVVTAGGLAALMTALRLPSAELGATVFRAVANLSYGADAIKHAVVGAGAHVGVIRAMKAHPADAEVRAPMISHHRHDLPRSPTTAHCSPTISRERLPWQVQYIGCGALGSLALGDPPRRKAAAEPAPRSPRKQSLVAAPAGPSPGPAAAPAPAPAATAASGPAAAVAEAPVTDPARRQLLVEAGAAEAIVAAMEQQYGHRTHQMKVLRSGCAALEAATPLLALPASHCTAL